MQIKKIINIIIGENREMRGGRIFSIVVGFLLIIWLVTSKVETRPTYDASVLDNGNTSDNSSDGETSEITIPTVRYVVSEGKVINKVFVRSGITKPSSKINIISELSAKVVGISELEGRNVKKGAVLLELDNRDIRLRVKEAKVRYDKFLLERNSVEKLSQGGHRSQLDLANANLNLASAEAALQKAKIDLERSIITAEYSSYFEKLFVDLGSIVNPGQKLAEVIVLDPLTVSVYVSADEVIEIALDTKVDVEINQNVYAGKILNISGEADTVTKNFLIEVEINNKNKELKAGFFAKVKFVGKEVFAHKIESSWLIIDDEGELAVKLIDDNDIVQHNIVKLVEGERNETWVSGLPDKARLVSLASNAAEGRKIEKLILDDRYNNL